VTLVGTSLNQIFGRVSTELQTAAS